MKLFYKLKNFMNKVLLLGSTGLLGSAIKSVFENSSDFELLAPNREQLELRSPLQVADYIEDHMPDIIINCAGYNLVDNCEVEEHEQVLAQELNIDLVMQLSILSIKINAYFITFSSDYVFNGNKDTPYVESDVPNPINYYGQTKHAAEVKAISNNDKALVVRTSWLFGPNKNNFVSAIATKLKSEEPVTVVNDQLGCPTYTLDIANYLHDKIVYDKPSGLLHLVNDNPCSWYDFAIEIRNALGLSKDILPVSSDEFKRLATRPNYSILASENVKPMRSHGEALDEYLNKYL
jgi:dTDP-4-dehydrorhamnose reductase